MCIAGNCLTFNTILKGMMGRRNFDVHIYPIMSVINEHSLSLQTALDSFPEISVVTELKKDGETPSFKVRLGGKAYNRKTMKPSKSPTKLPLVRDPSDLPLCTVHPHPLLVTLRLDVPCSFTKCEQRLVLHVLCEKINHSSQLGILFSCHSLNLYMGPVLSLVSHSLCLSPCVCLYKFMCALLVTALLFCMS